VRPLLLLDVACVLDTYGSPVPPPGFTEHNLFPEDDEPVRLNLEHGAWLAEAARNWAATRTGPTLLITADPAIGLTRDAADRVIAWAAALGSDPPAPPARGPGRAGSD
jgi:hypothetical protein